MSEITYRTSSVGLFSDLKFIGHETAEAYDQEAQEVGACVEAADMNDLWRSALPAFKDAVTPKIIELSGITVPIDEAKTAAYAKRVKDAEKAKPVNVTFDQYTRLVKSQVSTEVWASIDSYVREQAAITKIDVSPATRASSTSRGASMAAYKKADEILTRNPEAISQAVTSMLALVPDGSVVNDENGLPTRESLATLVGAYLKAVASSI